MGISGRLCLGVFLVIGGEGGVCKWDVGICSTCISVYSSWSRSSEMRGIDMNSFVRLRSKVIGCR